MTDMSLQPSSTSPGRTYKYYTGTPVFEFGHGLHYTTFEVSWSQKPQSIYEIQNLVKNGATSTFATFSVTVKNTGQMTSDYVALLFVSGQYGPVPYYNKQLISYTRVKAVKPGGKANTSLVVALQSIARVDNNGNLWLYPGSYNLTVDTPGLLTAQFELRGQAVQLTHFPQNNSTD